MQRQVASLGGHIYPAITVGDSASLHAGDVHIHGDHPALTAEHKCHQTFKTSTYEDFKNRNINRAPGTCQWVLNHPHFLSWRRDLAQNLLWISADPGCGKSVLAKSLVDHDLSDGTQPTVCYFFFKDNELQDNLATALCAVLHQLFAEQPDLIRHALPTWQMNGDKLQRESEEMWRILQRSVLDPAARPVFCIFDALDECRDEDRRRLISLLCDSVSQSTTTSGSKLKFLVTSRPYNNVQRWFEEAIARWPHIRLRGEDENDQIRLEINLVIEQHIQTLAYDFSLPSQRQEQLRQQLQSMKHRTYLWLHLAMEEIFETYQNSLYPEKEDFPFLPTSVDQAYERILQKISPQQKPNARKILLIIAGAKRPLTIGELALALAAAKPQHKETESLNVPSTPHLEKQIRNWCGLFVYIQHSTLFLIHQTAKEFLLADQSHVRLTAGAWRASLSPMDVESEMAKLCVMYLCVVTHSGQGRMKQHSSTVCAIDGTSKTRTSITSAESDFYEYCLEHWVSHFEDDMVVDDPDFANRVLILYDTKSAVFTSWFTRFWNKLRPAYPWWNMSSQHAIAFAGHCKILELLNECHPIEVDALDGTENTALWYAANQGHAEVVEQLIHLGAAITTDRLLWYGSILQTAAEKGHWSVINSLLKYGAIGAADSSEILAIAAGMDHNDLVETIMKETENRRCRKVLLNTVLYIASGRGDERMVRVLLQRGTDIDALMPRGGTSLSIAVERGHRAVVQVLASAGADFITVSSRKLFSLLGEGSSIITQDGKNSLLLWAVHYGYEDIAESMLSNGADVNAKNKYGTPALCLATGNRSERTVDALLHRGADIDVVDEAGETPLSMAVKKGQVQIVQKLLDRGADLNCRTRVDGPLLVMAARLSNPEVVRALLDKGADVNLGTQNNTPLIMACKYDKWTTVRLLVERGADLNVSIESGVTALDYVPPGVCDELRDWLISCGAKTSGIQPWMLM